MTTKAQFIKEIEGVGFKVAPINGAMLGFKMGNDIVELIAVETDGMPPHKKQSVRYQALYTLVNEIRKVAPDLTDNTPGGYGMFEAGRSSPFNQARIKLNGADSAKVEDAINTFFQQVHASGDHLDTDTSVGTFLADYLAKSASRVRGR